MTEQNTKTSAVVERLRELLAEAAPTPWVEDDCNVFSKPMGDLREAAITRSASARSWTGRAEWPVTFHQHLTS